MFSDFSLDIIQVLNSGGLGNPGEVEAFNYFFTLMVAMGLLLLIPCAIMKLLNRS